MKKTLIILCCLFSAAAFAQNGFFMQAELGGGISNTCWTPFVFKGYEGQSSVTGYQGQVDFGYKTGKWQFSTGIGYMRTGVKLKYGTPYDFRKYGGGVVFLDFAPPYFYMPLGVTDFNPHFIVPVKIGYELHRFSKSLSLVPVIGAEVTYNMPRTFIYADLPHTPETREQFTESCNVWGVTGLLQLNLEYWLNKHYNITAGPSVHYMVSSLLNYKDQHDYAFLFNLGIKRSFSKKNQVIE